MAFRSPLFYYRGYRTSPNPAQILPVNLRKRLGVTSCQITPILLVLRHRDCAVVFDSRTMKLGWSNKFLFSHSGSVEFRMSCSEGHDSFATVVHQTSTAWRFPNLEILDTTLATVIPLLASLCVYAGLGLLTNHPKAGFEPEAPLYQCGILPVELHRMVYQVSHIRTPERGTGRKEKTSSSLISYKYYIKNLGSFQISVSSFSRFLCLIFLV